MAGRQQYLTLESKILEILNIKDANVTEIAEEINVDPEQVVAILDKLKSAGLLIEVQK